MSQEEREKSIFDKLNVLEKSQEQILHALTGNQSLGHKGLVHRMSDVEKLAWDNRGKIKEIKDEKNFNVKRFSFFITCMTFAVPLIIEVVKIIAKQ